MSEISNATPTEPEAPSPRLPVWFWSVLLLLAALFCASVFLTAGAVPLPWVDEASYSDPALNFVDGKGWRSGAWDTQPITGFWACNCPLYGILSLPFLSAFGTTVAVWRTTWAVLSSLALISLLWGCYRWRLLRTPWEGLLIALALLASPVFAFTATGGRGLESACLLVAGLALCLSASPRRKVSRWAFLGGGFLIPWVGFQLGPVAFALVGSFLLVDWRKTLVALFQLALGSAAGLVALLLALWPLGVAKVFLSKTIASGFTSVGSVAQLVLIDDDGARKHFKDGRYDFGEILGNMLKSDLTLKVVFLLCLAAVAAHLLNPRQAKASPVFWLSLSGLLSIPLAMMVAGRFVSYYYVFAFVPLVFALGAGWSSSAGPVRLFSRAALALACVSSLVWGFPRVVSQTYASQRERTGQVDKLVSANIRPGENVVCSPVAYYAVRKVAGNVYTRSYAGGRAFRQIGEEEKGKTKVAVLTKADEVVGILRKWDGDWQPVARLTGEEFGEGGELIVFRRR